ncbi:MAG: 30S ribosomal protein S1 [Moorellaceae bacterium]
MIKPEGFSVAKRDTEKLLWLAKERGTTLGAVVAKVTTFDNLPVWEVEFPDIPDAKGLVPFSEMGVDSPHLAFRFAGQAVNVKLKEVRGDGTGGPAAVCSRLAAVEEARKELLSSLREGQVIDCVVRAVLPREGDAPARLLVDIGGGVLVEVPRSRATRSQAMPLGALFKVGEAVKAKVLRVDAERGTVEVSVRDAYPDPWERASFKPGDFVTGVVANTDGSRVWVEVSPGVVGLAPYPLRGEVSRGDRVTCAVAKFDRENRKLRLRLRGVLA